MANPNLSWMDGTDYSNLGIWEQGSPAQAAAWRLMIPNAPVRDLESATRGSSSVKTSSKRGTPTVKTIADVETPYESDNQTLERLYLEDQAKQLLREQIYAKSLAELANQAEERQAIADVNDEQNPPYWEDEKESARRAYRIAARNKWTAPKEYAQTYGETEAQKAKRETDLAREKVKAGSKSEADKLEVEKDKAYTTAMSDIDKWEREMIDTIEKSKNVTGQGGVFGIGGTSKREEMDKRIAEIKAASETKRQRINSVFGKGGTTKEASINKSMFTKGPGVYTIGKGTPNERTVHWTGTEVIEVK